MQKLTSAAIYVIKNGGPKEFASMVVDLISEIYQTADRLTGLRPLDARRLAPGTIDDHLSHTMPALESLVSLYLIGAYATKRSRFKYLEPIIRTVVSAVGRDSAELLRKPIAFWPLALGRGEPEGLRNLAGRINLCAERVQTDPAFLKLFGSKSAAIEALCGYELLVELNSFLAVNKLETPDSVLFMTHQYQGLSFTFRPGLIAFPLENVSPLSLILLAAMKRKDDAFLSQVLFDPTLAKFLIADGGSVFARLLRGLDSDRDKLQSALHIWDFGTTWPKEVTDAISGLSPIQDA